MKPLHTVYILLSPAYCLWLQLNRVAGEGHHQERHHIKIRVDITAQQPRPTAYKDLLRLHCPSGTERIPTLLTHGASGDACLPGLLLAMVPRVWERRVVGMGHVWYVWYGETGPLNGDIWV